jgi:lipopolysaccharide transport system permease protein
LGKENIGVNTQTIGHSKGGRTFLKNSVRSEEETNLTLHDSSNDILVGLLAWRVWGTLGWHDIRQRYRRSILGPFWFTLSTAIMVAVLGALYATLLNQEIRDYLPFLAAGLVIWQYLGSVLNEGCSSFISSTGLIKQIRLPLTIHVCRTVWRNFLILLHSLPVLVVTLLAFKHWPSIEFILTPLGLLLLLLHGIWMGIILGLLCARFRDIPPIINNLVQVAFFLHLSCGRRKFSRNGGGLLITIRFITLLNLCERRFLASPYFGNHGLGRSGCCLSVFGQHSG